MLLAAIAIPLAGAATTSAGKGQIGGPPTLPLGHEDEGKKTTKPIVIGRGQTYQGPAEIVAYGWNPPADADEDPSQRNFCIWVEYPRQDDILFGTCAEADEPNSAIEINGEVQGISPKRARFTEVDGLFRSDVASIRVTYQRQGKKRHAKTTIARVTPDLQQKLKLPQGFGYWDAKVRGVIKLRSFKARAFDAAGKPLGSTNHLSRNRAP
jgi:hypothetical protein